MIFSWLINLHRWWHRHRMPIAVPYARSADIPLRGDVAGIHSQQQHRLVTDSVDYRCYRAVSLLWFSFVGIDINLLAVCSEFVTPSFRIIIRLHASSGTYSAQPWMNRKENKISVEIALWTVCICSYIKFKFYKPNYMIYGYCRIILISLYI